MVCSILLEGRNICCKNRVISRSRHVLFLSGNAIRHPLHRSLGGNWGRSGKVRKISPPPPPTHTTAVLTTNLPTLSELPSSSLAGVDAIFQQHSSTSCLALNFARWVKCQLYNMHTCCDWTYDEIIPTHRQESNLEIKFLFSQPPWYKLIEQLVI